jgi:hypothetical protein
MNLTFRTADITGERAKLFDCFVNIDIISALSGFYDDI